MALHRMLDHYLHITDAAARLLDPHRRPSQTIVVPPSGVVPIDLHTHDEAMAWFTTERLVLLRAVALTVRSDRQARTGQLAGCLVVLLELRGQLTQLLAIQQAALAAAQRLADRAAEASAHNGVGSAYAHLGNLDPGKHLQRALESCRELDNKYGQAIVYFNLAALSVRQGKPREAIRNAQRAYDLFAEVTDRAGQARPELSRLVARSIRGLPAGNLSLRTCVGNPPAER
jgi:tetratricopeptide (TPR) repeat protein